MQQTKRQTGIELLIRGGALLLGGTFLWSWLLWFTGPTRYDATIWWVDLRFLHGWLSAVCSVAFVAALLHRAVWSDAGVRALLWRRVVLACLIAALVLNTLATWRASMTSVMLGVPIPLTAVLAVGVWLMWRSGAVSDVARSFGGRARRAFVVLSAACCFALLAALTQMVWFGESDYRRPADAIVVYGCKAHADGTPSQALADRVYTACELYHEGFAPVIVMSGGPVRDSAINEPQVMADYAVSLGVPREAIVFDPDGLDTQATAENLGPILSGVRPTASPRLLAVSHDYHLPRVKLTLEREGMTAYTVPAEVRRGLPGKPYFMARETAAWWYYFFKPIVAWVR